MLKVARNGRSPGPLGGVPPPRGTGSACRR